MSKPRNPGRPKGDSDSRNTILDAAEFCFGTWGYAVGIRCIADRAKINSATIYHHFRNKENLFREVLRRKFLPLAQALENMADRIAESSSENSDFDPLEAHFRNVSGIFSRDPWVRKLMLTEVILNDGPARDFFVSEIIDKARNNLARIIGHGIEKGRYRNDLNPDMTLISVASMAIAPNLLKDLMEKVIGTDMNESFMTGLARHNAQVLARGLKSEDPSMKGDNNE